jgi:hypothetical protein
MLGLQRRPNLSHTTRQPWATRKNQAAVDLLEPGRDDTKQPTRRLQRTKIRPPGAAVNDGGFDQMSNLSLLYEKDFSDWTARTVDLLRQRRFAEVDILIVSTKIRERD